MLRLQTTLLSLAVLLLSPSLSTTATIQSDSRLPTSASPFPVQSRQVEADRLLELGTQQWRSAQFSAALQSLQEALTIYQKIKDQKKEVKTLRNIGNVHNLLANYAQAISYYQQSLDLARTIRDRGEKRRH
jgi:tetratricopeptide (TPR) repeat protein